MKYYLIIPIFSMLFLLSFTETTLTTTNFKSSNNLKVSGSVFTLENKTIDYGTVNKNSRRDRKVKFTNTGDKPLKILSATTSCGCVEADFPSEKIYPGESDYIKVKYDTKRVGPFVKTVTITTNDVVGTHTISLRGEVLQEEETSEPDIEPQKYKAKKSMLPQEIKPEFSEWYKADLGNKDQIKCRYIVAQKGIITLELQSNVSCKVEITSKICSNTMPDDRNGWQLIRLQSGVTKTINISESNSSCQNGFWWWLRNYKNNSVRID
jgi:Protein of unknown function (DUF1573)